VIRLLTGLLFLAIAQLSFAEALTYAQLEQLTVSPAQLEGQFSQHKYLSSMDISLTSTGVFDYQRGKSIRWETLDPIQNELLVTPTEIISRQGGQNMLQLAAESNPAVTAFSGIFFSVLTADWTKLAEYFELTGRVDGEQWQAELLPLNDSISQVVSGVRLKGDSLLREVILNESGGDTITIHFDHLKP